MGSVPSHMGKIKRALLPLWALFIALVGTLPLTNFVGHPHWEYIQWVPTANNFRSPRFLFDIVANMALFLPLGYLLDRSSSTTTTRRSLFLATGVAFLLSLSMEWFQVYCHNRHPSPTDVGSNVTGSLIGAFLSIYHQKIAASPPNHPRTPNPQDRNLPP
jgi:glycopeptide antibiotics resistance protein